MSDNDEELPPSRLGTLDHWEQCYQDELVNFKDHGDEGENWFGEPITRKIVTWISSHVRTRDTPILDVGCGNGLILSRLYQAGFTNLTGVDYSVKAVELATNICHENGATNAFISTLDIVSASSVSAFISKHSTYVLVNDKGTYDAICLTPDADIAQLRHNYYESVISLLQDDGYFVITSCNWTKEELLKHFAFNSSCLILSDEIVTPSISYGGKQGNQVTCLIFKKSTMSL